jgi:uncharacterized protein with FMN-binding domain
VVTGARRIALWFFSTVAVVVLLFGYKTSTGASTANGTAVASGAGSVGTASGSAGSGPAGSGPAGSRSGSSGSGSTKSGSTKSGSSKSGSDASTTVTGSSADTRWGPVQVQLTVAAGVITDVTVVDYPDGNGKDRQINARALPVLVQETLDAQSADIDMVSGATVTSKGYLRSLQSALDDAGL